MVKVIALSFDQQTSFRFCMNHSIVAAMSTVHLVPHDILERYHVKEWRNATGILATSCNDEWQDVQDVLRGFSLLRSEILVGGGNRSLISRRIDGAFYAWGWVERGFATSTIVDENQGIYM